MKFEFSEEERAFQANVRAFIKANYPNSLPKGKAREQLSKHDLLVWYKILAEHGWSVPSWPVEYGGTGWSVTERYIWLEENARADTIMPSPPWVNMVGPVIYTYGSEAQRKQHLPGLISGDTWWCQGFSEPGAGSDLASLSTRAERHGDHYIVNGQKSWTTFAHNAEWGFFLCRTNPEAPKKQQGISFILIDMSSPGVEVRPVKTIDGSCEINETWLTDVKVPVENLVGNESEGWTYAKFLLAFERTGIAGIAKSKRRIEKLRQLLSERITNRPDAAFDARLTQVEMDLTALEVSELRAIANSKTGSSPGAVSSFLKIKGTEVQQRITELILELGAQGVAPDYRGASASIAGRPNLFRGMQEYAAPGYFNTRKSSIYGGSNEIQREVLARSVLGL